MRGQGKRKKIKVDPSLARVDDEEKNDGGNAGDNLPGNVQHPLFNELVMEMLFKNFLLLNHDESDSKSALAHLADLRPVCKTWNREIGKMIRKKRQINMRKLITAYPKGLGWAATTTTTGGDHDEKTFQYSVPFPEEIGTFENLKASFKSCKVFNTSILKWFQMNGSSVKSLHLTCSLSCYHHNRFVEKILKNWCPNLESFTLQGAECCQSLVQSSFFAEPSLENQCRSLKEFIVAFNQVDCDYRGCQSRETCSLRIEDLETTVDQNFQDVEGRKKVDKALSTFVENLVNYVDKVGEPTTSEVEETDLLNKLVRRPIGLNSLDDGDGRAPRTFGSRVPDLIQGNFICDPGYENDGGIIGQLMKMSRIKKFVIQKANETQEWLFNKLFAMFFYRPNLWMSTLQDFECLDNFPAIISVWSLRHFPRYKPPKNIFSKVGFPLKRLKLDSGFHVLKGKFESKSMHRILSGCAETLEELEFGLIDPGHHQSVVTLPVMPSLKLLVVQSKGSCVVKVTYQDVLGKLPKLEKCRLTLGRKTFGAENSFFQKDYIWGGSFWGLGENQSHPLKEFKLLDQYVNEKDIERMVMCFPNLKIVDLSIVRQSGKDFKAFWENVRRLPLEKVKISFSMMVKSAKEKTYDLYENAIADNFEGLKGLQWLELVHEGQHPYPLTRRLSDGFAKASRLRFLKLTNFQVDEQMAEEIKKTLASAVVQLPAKKSSVATRLRSKT